MKEERVTSEDLEELIGVDIDCETAQAETEALRIGIRNSMIALICAICIMIIAEILTGNRVDFGKMAVIPLISSILNLTEGKQLNDQKAKKKGIFEAVVTGILFILYIGEIVLL